MTDTPALYRDMQTVAVDELTRAGMDTEQADEVAGRIVSVFCRQYGGETYRVPCLVSMDVARRNAQIRDEIEHDTVARIASRYGLSEAHVRRIVNNCHD